VRHRRVDNTCDEEAVEEVSSELAPLRDGARHYGGRRGCEHELEQPEGVGVGVQACVEELTCSEELVSSSSIGQAPAHCPVGDASHQSVQGVLDENVHGVLGPHGACFQEGEATLHEENQEGDDDEEELVVVFQHLIQPSP